MSISVDMHPEDNDPANYRVECGVRYKEFPGQCCVKIGDGKSQNIGLHSLTADDIDRLADEFHKIATSLRPPAERIADLTEKLTNGEPLQEINPDLLGHFDSVTEAATPF